MSRFLISGLLTMFLFVSCGSVSDELAKAGTTNETYNSDPVSNEMRSGVGEVFSEMEEITPSLESYTLPIADREEILNLQRDIVEKAGIEFSDSAMEKLLANGFVVLEGEQIRFQPYYFELAEKEIPVFVSSDSVMHLFHLYFDQILKYVEVKYFLADLKLMISAMVEESKRHYNTFEQPEMKNAALMELAYLSVIMKTLNPDYLLTEEVRAVVSQEIVLIEKHEKMTKSIVFSNDCPVAVPTDVCIMKPSDILELGRDKACYCEDFTQYIPRGHYDQTENLKRYFKAMIYMGRLSFLMKNNRSTIASVLLMNNLKSVKVKDGRKAIEIWEKIYRVTSFFVGASDDLLPSEYDTAFKDVFGDGSRLDALLEDKKMEEFVVKIESLRNPGILGSVKNGLLDRNEETKGLRLMGQRFAPDSFVLSEVVGDNAGIDQDHAKKAEIFEYAHAFITLEDVETHCPDLTGVDPLTFGNTEMYCACGGSVQLYQLYDDESYLDFCRLMPSGLDVMTVLGSAQSKKIQAARDYKFVLLEGTHNRLIDDFSKYTLANWSQNVYWGWLYMLKPMLQTHGEGWPAFMQTEVWQAFTFNSALSSWSQLRHDTILYVKQSYTESYDVGDTGDTGDTAEPYDPKYYAYMEPTPEFLDRTYQLLEMTKKGLATLGFDDSALQYSFSRGSEMVKRLRDIAIKELENEPLEESDYDYLMAVGSQFSSIITKLAEAVIVETNNCDGEYCDKRTTLEGEGDDDPFDVRIVADVHTDPNTKSVLETATGFVDYIVVIRKMENGTLGAVIGPVFSYREFTHPMDDRLTDTKWREMIASDSDKGLPEWASSFRE